jgi:hypothetical protein
MEQHVHNWSLLEGCGFEVNIDGALSVMQCKGSRGAIIGDEGMNLGVSEVLMQIGIVQLHVLIWLVEAIACGFLEGLEFDFNEGHWTCQGDPLP